MRGKQSTGHLTAAEALAEVTLAAENLEEIFYGNVAGWSATNWWDEKGLGYHLATIQGVEDPKGRVVDLLLYASARALAIFDAMMTDPTYLRSEADFLELADEVAAWFTGIPPAKKGT
jgi:hypothetical protein